MTLETRRPTGKPPWPITLLAGGEKSGKSWACAEASGSDLIGRTFWISLGEDDPDEYGAVPGADFEIVLHNGTYRDILRAVTEAVAAPMVDDKPNLIILDSFGNVWELLSDMAQSEANRRAMRRANNNRAIEEATINSDLWNLAKARWNHILKQLRAHRGPVIVTARLEETTVFNDKGDPTKDKTLKVKAQKGLPFDVGVIVQMPARGEAWLTGVRSVLNPQTQDRVKLDNFTVDKLWRHLGLAEPDATADRQHSGIVVDPEHTDDTPDDARTALLDVVRKLDREPGAIAALYEARHGRRLQDEADPEPIRALIAELQPAGG